MNETNENKQAYKPDAQEVREMMRRATREMKAWCDEGNAHGRKRAAIVMMADIDIEVSKATGLKLGDDDNICRLWRHGSMAVANIAAATLLEQEDMESARLLLALGAGMSENKEA